MPLTGRVFRVKDQLALVPILLGDIPPLFGYGPWVGVTVNAEYIIQLEVQPPIGPPITIPVPISSSSGTTDSAGRFSVPSDVQNPFPDNPVWVALTVTSGVPLYRSSLVPLHDINTGHLNLWLFPDTLPSSDGITAGSISTQLKDGLPAGTILTTGPAGLDLFGIHESVIFPNDVDIKDLGIAITPDSSTNLQSFVDVSIRSSNIDIEFPTSLFVSNDQVLQYVQGKIAGAAGGLNSKVLTTMEANLESQPGVTSAMAEKFFTEEVSVTFRNVNFSDHMWGIGNTGDKTVVITADPCIGFPRTVTPGEPVL